MTAESKRFLELIERRIELLRSLAENLTSARGEFIAMDLNAMERRTAEQNQMCARIRSLDSEISKAQTRRAEKTGARLRSDAICWAASPEDGARDTEKIHNVMQRLVEAQLTLKKINSAHQAMLRGSRRTIKVLQNLYNSFAPTYSVPSAAMKSFEERG